MFGNPTGVERDLAQALHVNDSATFGCLPEGNKTEGHFHVMGVFNYMIGKRGDGSAKIWSFYELKYPRIEAAREAEAVKPLTQYPGDLVYIPPGWGHEVYTCSGTNKGTRRQHNKYTSHFVSWIMPRDYIGTKQGFAHLAHFMSGRRLLAKVGTGLAGAPPKMISSKISWCRRPPPVHLPPPPSPLRLEEASRAR